MATVNYNPVIDVPEREGLPDDRPPNDYNDTRASPASFGGEIAQGTKELGEGALSLNKYWGGIQVDDASNNAQKEGSEFVEHIRTLQGQDALDAQKTAGDQLDKIYNNRRNQVPPGLQVQFDNQNRPYFDRYLRGQMNTTFIDAGRQFADQTANSANEVAHGMAATAGSDNNWATVEVARAKALGAQIKLLQQKGLENDPDARETARQKADLTYKSAIEGLALKDPDAAQARLEDPKIKDALSKVTDASGVPVYATLSKAVEQAVGNHYISLADELEATNPKAAVDFVVKNKAKFGERYGAELDRVNKSSTVQDGEALNSQANQHVASGGGAVVGSSAPGGFDMQHYMRVTQGIEDPSGNPTIRNASGHQGLYQFGDKEWAQYGGGADRNDPAAQQRAMAAYTTDHVNQLRMQLGRDPTEAEVYLAHQQGVGGAVALMTNPTARAGTVVGDDAVKQNGGDPNMTAGAFAQMWLDRFNRGKPGGSPLLQNGEAVAGNAPESVAPTNAAFTPENPPATAPKDEGPVAPVDPSEAANQRYEQKMQFINDSSADEKTKEEAARAATNQLNRELAAAGGAAREIKAREEAASNDVLGSVNDGKPQDAYDKLDKYRKTHSIDEKFYDQLSDVVAQRTGDPNPKYYGPGYADAVKRLLLPAADPQHIGDVRQIIEMEANHQITSRGSADLMRQMGALAKSEDEAGLAAVRSEGFKALEAKMSGGSDINGGIKSPKGLEMFRTVGVAQYNRAYNDWRAAVKAGKGDDFFQLSDPKKLDAFAESIYPQRQRDADALSALGEDGDLAPEAPGTPLPPAPKGVDQTGWARWMQAAPNIKINGQAMSHAGFAKAVSLLASDPAPEVVSAFDAFFGPSKITAADVLKDILPTARGPTTETGTAVPLTPALESRRHMLIQEGREKAANPDLDSAMEGLAAQAREEGK